ncbi:MAG: ankyrin repeat domain-containing protein [Spirochaetales bacterium]|uniref:Ankyrin repeat domain-containing protein n=1 Tax=Candidatus Thalassospirochaeta sargassi TaxID=3119039 RepID=A0AAJ1IE68_9SPIO|nr:ankyrin repeat domain-containing protein [Spirochaetales bacterium]
MKKIFIILMLSLSMVSCLTMRGLVDEVTDAAVAKVERDVEVETEEVVLKNVELAVDDAVDVTLDEAGIEKALPTEQEIIDAVKSYDLEGLKELLAEIEDVRTIVGDNVLLCHMAEEAMGMIGQKNELLSLLVEKKAYIMQVDSEGKKMTRYADEMEMYGSPRMDYMNEIIGDKFMRRIKALRADDLDTIISMTDYFPIDDYLLQSAVDEKAFSVAEWVIEQGVSVDGVVPKSGDSLLHLACNGRPINTLFDDRIDFVKTLLDAGVEVNMKNKKGDTPIGILFLAEDAGKHGSRNSLAKVLLDAGADVNTVTSRNRTLLYHAVLKRNDSLIKLLLDSGSVIDNKSIEDLNLSLNVIKMFMDRDVLPEKFAKNVISFSDKTEQLDFIKMLIDSGVSPSAFNLPDVTRNFAALKFLVESGADINSGKIVQSCVADFRDTEVLGYLVENGADLNKKFHNDMTALHYAVRYKKNDIVEFLIANNVDVNAVDSTGKTPLDYCKERNEVLMDILTEAGAKVAEEL